MENTLIVIGYTGMKSAYLNITREEAVRRYKEEQAMDEEQAVDSSLIQEFKFGDQFNVYDAWGF